MEIEVNHYDYDLREFVSDGTVNVRDFAKALSTNREDGPRGMAKLLEDFTNGGLMGSMKKGQEIGKHLRRTHPSLQRGIIALLVGMLVELAETHQDARNHDAVEFAKKVKRLWDEQGTMGASI